MATTLTRMPLTRALAWAAATDAGDRSMRLAHRSRWSYEDFNAAVREFDRIWPVERDINSVDKRRNKCL